MIIDTHCHYNLDPLATNWQKHWSNAQAAGVKTCIVVGTNPESSSLACKLAHADHGLFAAIGVHPSEYQDDLERDVTADITVLRQQASDARVVAIGETGLDYFRLPEEPDLAQRVKRLQQQAFAAHVKLAEERALPLIIHVRDTATAIEQSSNAYLDVLDVLRAYRHTDTPFILHCISGPPSYVQTALAMGAYIGVAANCTYKKSDAIRDLVRLAPAQRVLSETDAPFLPPQQFRGQVCEPWMISKTVDFIESELGIPPSQLVDNAQRLFPQLMLQ